MIEMPLENKIFYLCGLCKRRAVLLGGCRA